MNIFEQASKQKLRFGTVKGTLSTEDLWDLKLEDLDKIAQAHHKLVVENENVSFISNKPKTNPKAELQLEILKHIIKEKLEDRERKALTQLRKEKREKLLALIEHKEDEQLSGQSIDELKKQLAELDE